MPDWAVLAFVRVNGSATFSAAYTTSGTQFGFNCAGTVPQARRLRTGVYLVGFPNNGAQLALGNVIAGEDDFLTWVRVNDPVTNEPVFQVTIVDHNANRQDRSFVIVLI